MGYCMYLGPMHLAGFATQNISCSCWATGLVLWYLSQVWVVINTARPKKCVSIVMTLSTQRAAILMHSRKNIVLWTLTPPGFAFRIHVTNTKYLLPWPPRTHRTGHPWVPNTSPQTELRMSISWRVLSFIEYTYIEYIYIYCIYIYIYIHSIIQYTFIYIYIFIYMYWRFNTRPIQDIQLILLYRPISLLSTEWSECFRHTLRDHHRGIAPASLPGL